MLSFKYIATVPLALRYARYHIFEHKSNAGAPEVISLPKRLCKLMTNFIEKEKQYKFVVLCYVEK